MLQPFLAKYVLKMTFDLERDFETEKLLPKLITPTTPPPPYPSKTTTNKQDNMVLYKDIVLTEAEI